MSGWFGTGNPELNDPFYGIEAGHRRRRNNQMQRRDKGRARGPKKPSLQEQQQKQVRRKPSGITTQKYLGFELTTSRNQMGIWSTNVTQGRLPRHQATGKSKGESVNAAKNWVDSQVVKKVDPNMNRAVQKSEQKATRIAEKVAKQETAQVEKKAREVARSADVAVQRVMKDPMASRQQKRNIQNRANKAKKAARSMVQSAKAGEKSRAKKMKSPMAQKILNEEVSKKRMFTETRPNPAAVMPVSTSPGDVAARNRDYTKMQMRTQWKPTTMPNDFVVGKFTVRAVYNPTLKNYVVSIRAGDKIRKKKTFGKNEGQAALNKFKTFTSIAKKRAKYDSEVSKEDTKGKYTVKLVVKQKSLDSVAGGFFSGLMNMFGLGRMSIDQIAKENQARAAQGQSALNKQEIMSRGPQSIAVNRPGPTPTGRGQQIAKQMQQRARQQMDSRQRSLSNKMAMFRQGETASMTPPGMRNRTQSASTKAKSALEQAVEQAEKQTILEGDIEKMPAKTMEVQVIDNETGQVVKSMETASYEKASEEFETELSTVANNPTIYDDQSKKAIPEAPVADGDGGDITKEAVAPPPPTPTTTPAPAAKATVPAPAPAETVETTVPVSENYDEMVKAAPSATIEPMTDGDFYRTYQRPQEYQPAPTYQAQTTTVTPAPAASPGLTSNQAIGLGALALAGYVYTKQSAPKRRKR